MSSYRYDRDLAERYGERATQIRDTLRRAEIDGYTTDDRPRVNVDQDETGDVAQIECDRFDGPGIIARPAADAVVEAAVGNVGASGDHAVVLGILDHGKFRILEVEPIGDDETVIYNQSVRVRLVGSEIRASSVGDDGAPLAFKSDADALNSRIAALETAVNALVTIINANVLIFNSHTHEETSVETLPTATPQAPGVPAVTAATVAGTAVLKAE